MAVIALSVSGETRQVVDICRQLKERGCTLISLTYRPGCTLARISDLNISYNMEELRVGGGWQMTCQAPVVCLLEMIGRRLYQVRPRPGINKTKSLGRKSGGVFVYRRF